VWIEPDVTIRAGTTRIDADVKINPLLVTAASGSSSQEIPSAAALSLPLSIVAMPVAAFYRFSPNGKPQCVWRRRHITAARSIPPPIG
jgi:hypothetical protein